MCIAIYFVKVIVLISRWPILKPQAELKHLSIDFVSQRSI